MWQGVAQQVKTIIIWYILWIKSLKPLFVVAEPGIDYIPITAEEYPLDIFIAGTSIRRDCFHLSILEDATAEYDEYLFLDLYLEEALFDIQEGTRIILNSTIVTIRDNSGKSLL